LSIALAGVILATLPNGKGNAQATLPSV